MEENAGGNPSGRRGARGPRRNGRGRQSGFAGNPGRRFGGNPAGLVHPGSSNRSGGICNGGRFGRSVATSPPSRAKHPIEVMIDLSTGRRLNVEFLGREPKRLPTPSFHAGDDGGTPYSIPGVRMVVPTPVSSQWRLTPRDFPHGWCVTRKLADAGRGPLRPCRRMAAHAVAGSATGATLRERRRAAGGRRLRTL